MSENNSILLFLLPVTAYKFVSYAFTSREKCSPDYLKFCKYIFSFYIHFTYSPSTCKRFINTQGLISI